MSALKLVLPARWPAVLDPLAWGISLGVYFLFRSLLMWQFLTRYETDIYGKGFSEEIISEMLSLAASQFVVECVTLAVAVGLVVAFARLGRSRLNVWQAVLGLLVVLLMAGWSRWQVNELRPEKRAHMMSLLYDMSRTAPGEPLEVSDPYQFIPAHSAQTSDAISSLLDSISAKVVAVDSALHEALYGPPTEQASMVQRLQAEAITMDALADSLAADPMAVNELKRRFSLVRMNTMLLERNDEVIDRLRREEKSRAITGLAVLFGLIAAALFGLWRDRWHWVVSTILALGLLLGGWVGLVTIEEVFRSRDSITLSELTLYSTLATIFLIGLALFLTRRSKAKGV